MDASFTAAYRHALQRFRVAIQVAPGLCDRDRRVAALMLEWVNRSVFENSGAVCTWVGVQTLAECLRADRTKVQRAHRALRKAGVIEIEKAGGGRGRTTVHTFSRAWLDAVAAEVEARGPAPLVYLLRAAVSGTAAAGAALSGLANGVTGDAVSGRGAALSAGNSVTSAALSGQGAALFGANGVTSAALSEQSAALSTGNGVTSAAASGQGAALSPEIGGTDDAVSAQGAALFDANGVTGAAVSDEGAALSAAIGDAGAAVGQNGGTGAALSGRFGGRESRNGGTGVVQRASPVQPEPYDSNPLSPRPPVQRSLLLPLAGGRADVGTAVNAAQAEARAIAAVESDGRFEQLRRKAAQLLGDARTASLAIACMDDRVKRNVLRGHWPRDAELAQVLRAGLAAAGRPIEAAPVKSPVPPMPAGASPEIAQLVSATVAEVLPIIVTNVMEAVLARMAKPSDTAAA